MREQVFEICCFVALKGVCFVFNSSEVWCIQLNDSVIDIAHLPDGKVFAALADGSIAVLQVK